MVYIGNMKRRIESEVSGRTIHIRCTVSEFSTWESLAKKREKSLSRMIRDGLNEVASRTCLCAPGQPKCIACRPKAQVEPPKPVTENTDKSQFDQNDPFADLPKV